MNKRYIIDFPRTAHFEARGTLPKVASTDGGDNGSTNSTSNASIPGAQQVSTIKLADSANSYATGKTAAGYVLYGSRDVYQLYLSSLAAMIYGANHSAAGSYSEACASGGTISVTLIDSDNSRSITGGDSANISFVNCKQSVSTLAGLVTETINGACPSR